jgi:hypothetical protein
MTGSFVLFCDFLGAQRSGASPPFADANLRFLVTSFIFIEIVG